MALREWRSYTLLNANYTPNTDGSPKVYPVGYNYVTAAELRPNKPMRGFVVGAAYVKTTRAGGGALTYTIAGRIKSVGVHGSIGGGGSNIGPKNVMYAGPGLMDVDQRLPIVNTDGGTTVLTTQEYWDTAFPLPEEFEITASATTAANSVLITVCLIAACWD